MSLVSLIVHGLSAMSIYTDKIFIRVLLAAGFVAGMAGLGIAAVTAIRVATDFAVPGWATTAAGDLAIILAADIGCRGRGEPDRAGRAQQPADRADCRLPVLCRRA